MAPRGFPVFPVAICPPTVPSFPGGSQNSIPSSQNAEQCGKGIFPGAEGEAAGSHTSRGVGVLTLQQNGSKKG